MKKTTFLIILLFLSITVYAQEDEKIEETDQNFTTVKIYSPNKEQDTKNRDYYKWAIKTDLIQYVTGDFSLYAEYSPIKRFSVEFGIGTTYSIYENFTPYIGSGEEIEKFDFNNDINNSNIYFLDNSSGKSRFKPSLRLALKYYFDGSYSGIDGWYIGLQYAYKTYTKDYSLPEKGDKYDLSRTKTSGNLLIGYQFFTDNYFLHNIAIGIGYAHIEQDFMTNNLITNEKMKVKGTRITPNFILSYSIGFGN